MKFRVVSEEIRRPFVESLPLMPALEFDTKYPWVHAEDGFPFRMATVRRHHLGYSTHGYTEKPHHFAHKVRSSIRYMVEKKGYSLEKAIPLALASGKEWLSKYRIGVAAPGKELCELIRWYPAQRSLIESELKSSRKLAKIA